MANGFININKLFFLLTILTSQFVFVDTTYSQADGLKKNFFSPPNASKPGVYWYFMDGNIDKAAITADLKSMKSVGIGSVIFLEVNVGVPRGKINFLSNEWQDLFAFAVSEAEKMGIAVTLGSGPGWAGSGGPWVKPEQSMQHLVASATTVEGPFVFRDTLAKPLPKKPFFGEQTLPEKFKKLRNDWYEDVAVLAYPTPKIASKITDIDEKSLVYRAPYSSAKNVKPFLNMPASYNEITASVVDQSKIIDLTSLLKVDGSLMWEIPAGKWTIVRIGKRNNGAITRPAPQPGLGFECDKLDSNALDAHFDAFYGKLLKKTGSAKPNNEGGWKMLHIDSWEMGAQNWTQRFRQEFTQRRGYDPLKYLPTYMGQTVGSLEQSERFLWDMRLTAQELVIQNHAERLKELGRRNDFKLSIEPYDMNPTSDMDLGSVADVPMCEFWSENLGFNATFSCFEATSIAHIQGKKIVAAEAFTADVNEAWKKYPSNMKDQTDWAFCMGINKLVFHTFAHKPYGDNLKPGVVMGPYGVHWDRAQTWWPMVSSYHEYVSRCQYMLSQGKYVADILYLTPEGAPQVFKSPNSALEGSTFLPDKRAYAFDACSPILLQKASVSKGRIVFPGGASYRVMVLPDVATMTPELLSKIASLAKAGAKIIGNLPTKSPSLVNYPNCDKKVQALSQQLLDSKLIYKSTHEIIKTGTTAELYCSYDSVAKILQNLNVNPDFISSSTIRYTHRSLPDREIYFISNRSKQSINEKCVFRDGTQNAELWDAVTGKVNELHNLTITRTGIATNLKLDASQSFFVVFYKFKKINTGINTTPNFPEKISIDT